MNSKTISEPFKKFYDAHRIQVTVAGLVLVLTGVLLLVAYCGASSKIDVPKADQADANANALQQQAATSEGNANVYREVRRENDKATSEAKSKLTTTKKRYEEVRDTPITIDSSNLDSRERKLQSDLTNLYRQGNSNNPL